MDPWLRSDGEKIVKKYIRDRFSSEGDGIWAPLSPMYAEWKNQNYPGKTILRRTDRMYNDAVNNPQIRLFGNTMLYEIDNPIAKYHQHGTSRMPARPIFEEDPKQLSKELVDSNKRYIREKIRS